MAVFLCTAGKQWIAADVAWLINQHDGFSKINTTQLYVWDKEQTYADKLSEILSIEEDQPDTEASSPINIIENKRYFTTEDVSNAANKLALVCPTADLMFDEGETEEKLDNMVNFISESNASKLVVILNTLSDPLFNETVSIDYTKGGGEEEFDSFNDNLQHFVEYNGDIGNRIEEIRSAIPVSLVYVEYEKLISGDQTEYQTLTSALGLTPLSDFAELVVNIPNPIKVN